MDYLREDILLRKQIRYECFKEEAAVLGMSLKRYTRLRRRVLAKHRKQDGDNHPAIDSDCVECESHNEELDQLAHIL